MQTTDFSRKVGSGEGAGGRRTALSLSEKGWFTSLPPSLPPSLFRGAIQNTKCTKVHLNTGQAREQYFSPSNPYIKRTNFSKIQNLNARWIKHKDWVLGFYLSNWMLAYARQLLMMLIMMLDPANDDADQLKLIITMLIMMKLIIAMLVRVDAIHADFGKEV